MSRRPMMIERPSKKELFFPVARDALEGEPGRERSRGRSLTRIFIIGGPICFTLRRLPDGPLINA